MPLLLLAALAVSLLVHALFLFGADYRGFAERVEPPPLQAELKVLPPLPLVQPAAPAPRSEPVFRKKPAQPVPVPAPVALEETLPLAPPPELVEPAAKEAAPAPVMPVLAGSGRTNFIVVRDSPRMNIGRAVHQWEFPGDGTYRLTGMIETSGLVALFKPVRQEYESVGRLGAKGLQPECFRVLRQGRPAAEGADFDWDKAEITLLRDGSILPVAPGTQDLLSMNYQLAYLPALEYGTSMGVVTGKKYERYALDAYGGTWLETPAGRFRTLHLRAAGETLMDIWIALDHGRLPVKIRFTDKKGDSYEQIATDIEPAPVALDPNTSGNP